MGHKEYRQSYRYRVKWKDTPQEQWLSEDSLIHCKELLRAYHREQNLPFTPFLTTTSENQETEKAETSSDSSDEEEYPAATPETSEVCDSSPQ